MITKKSIAEQVQRIVNGGSSSDDSKVTLQEVIALVEQERDAMVRKHILENSVLGDHEMPSAFLTKRKFDVALSSIYGVGGRPFVSLMHSPLSLPNDDAIYRVCSTPVRSITKVDGVIPSEQIMSDERKVAISNFTSTNTSTPYQSNIQFKNKTGTSDVGNKFVFSFKHGYDANTVKDYSFTFTYKNPSDRRNTDIVNQNSLNPQVLLMSLNNNKDFQDFLKVNKLKFSWLDSSASGYWTMILQSHYSTQHFGVLRSNHFDFKSILTNASIVDWNTDDALTITSTYSQAGGQNYPTLGFGITIEYSKNKKLKELGADVHNIKAQGSTSLTTYIELTEDDIREDGSEGYESILGVVLAQMWLNKYAGLLKPYGIIAVIEDGALFIREAHNNGGFDGVTFNSMTGLTGTVTIPTVDSVEVKNATEKANYSGVECYSRMSNPGQFSMFDNAILLSGRKYWYRENKKIYLYNSDHKNFNGEGLEVTVWFIAASNTFNDFEEFPIPHETVPEMIKSLVATFSLMRQAKEDVVNDNIDMM